MQNKNAVLNILLIAIISMLFLLITGGEVNASENYWTSTDVFPVIWDNKVGKTFSGNDNGVDWTCKITEKDTTDGTGKVILTINNPTEISGEIQLPDKVQFHGGFSETAGATYVYEVESISMGSFSNASNVTSVIFGKYIKQIPEGLFENCTSLKEVVVGESVEEIGEATFAFCESLEKISVISNNSNYLSEDGVLFDKNRTELIAYPINKTIQSYVIPETVTEIGNIAFFKVKNLTDITISSNVTKIGDGSFAHNSNLRNINFLEDSKLNSIGKQAFIYCEELSNFNVPDNVTSIGEGCFTYCTNLVNVKLPKGLKEISDYLFYCCNIEDIELPDTLIYIGKNSFEENEIISLEIPETVTEIKGSAFKNCKKLKEIKLPSNLQVINSETFKGCTELKDIEIPKTIKNINNDAFASTGLTSVEIPKSTETIGESAFAECSNLLTVVLSNTVGAIGANAFSGCNSNLVIYCYNCDETFINKINANSSVLTAYALCEGIDSEEDGVEDYVKINKFVEGSCTQIKLLSHVYGLPIKELEEGSFYGNTKIQKITIPNTVTTLGHLVFGGCTSLNNVVLPKAIENIPDQAFEGCTSLSKVVIKKGSAIASIGEKAFNECSANLIVYHDGENTVISEYGANLSTFKIDNQAPSARVSDRVSNDKLSATIEVSNIRDEGGSGAEFYAISLSSNVEDIQDSEWKEVTSNNVTMDVRKNDTWHIHLMDMVGNVKNITRDISGIDETAPTFSGEPTIEYNINGAEITITVTDEANGSGLKGYTIINSSDTKNISNWNELDGYSVEIKDVVTSNGTWYLHVKDNAGNIITKEIVVTEIDNVKPWVGDIVESYNDLCAMVKVSIFDDKSLEAYAIDLNQNVLDGTKWIAIEENAKEYTIEQTIEANGTYYVHIKDKYGNTNDSVTSFEIKDLNDGIAPRVEVVEKTNNVIKVKITDAFSGIAEGAKISYAWGESKETAPENYTQIDLKYETGAKEVVFEVPCEGEGTYYLWLNIEELKDVEGNSNTEEKICSNSYTFDVVAPTISSVTANKSIVKSGETVIFTIITSEDVTKTDGILPKVEQNEQVQCELGQLTGEGKTWNLTLTAGEGNGNIIINIPKEIFKDSIGNTLLEDRKEVITIDNEAPDLSDNEITKVTISDSIISQGQESTFTFTSEEELVLIQSKIEEITLTNGDITGTIKAIESENKKIWKITVIGGLGDGDVNLKLPTGLFVDTAGNEAEEVVYKGLTFDNTAPEIEIMNPDVSIANSKATVVYIVKSNEIINKNEGTIELKNVNDGDTISAIVDVAKVDEEGKEWKVTLTNCTGNGDARLLIPAGYFIDEAGNTNTVKEKTGLKVDNTAIGIKNISEPTLDETKEKAIVEIELEDTNEKLQYVVSKSETIEGITEEWKDVTTNPLKIEITEPGIYYVYIKDEAGNITQSDRIEISATILDKTGPSLEVKYETEYGQVKVIITSNEEIQLADGWNYANEIKTEIEKIFTEDTNITIQVKDLAGNASEVSISVEIPKEESFFVRLIEESEYKMVEDGEKIYIENINPNTEIDTVIGNIETNGDNKKIYKGDTEVTGDVKVGTGMTLRVSKGAEQKEYILVVKGDATGDGEVNAVDLIVAVKQYKYARTNGQKGENLEGAELRAIKFTEESKYTPVDLIGEVKMFKANRSK